MIYIGIDVGSVSIKAAAIGAPGDDAILREVRRQHRELFLPDGDQGVRTILWSQYRRILGEPVLATCRLLKELVQSLPRESVGGIRLTGIGGQTLARAMKLSFENDFCSVARGIGEFYPKVRTILELGGNTSRYVRVTADSQGRAGIADYGRNGDCAAGTGAFMDQQASRLRYAIEDVGELVRSVEASANIAGRCTVFSKTDMVHAQQKGYTPPQILKGLCEAVVRNFKGTVIKGKQIASPVAVVGGMAANSGIVRAIHEIFQLKAEELIVPKAYAWMSALGAALLEAEEGGSRGQPFDPALCLKRIEEAGGNKSYEHAASPPLSMQNVVLLRNRNHGYSFEGRALPVEACLGIDVGSVSTNLAVIDGNGDLIDEVYLRTDSRPIEVAGAGLLLLKGRLAEKIRITAVGATGSGRELIGELVGADLVMDEITAHKTGAAFIAHRLLDSRVDTIFEIGGQDAKFIRLENGVVVDFSMNEACSAGTGSFLEEQAERLGIRIEEEFARLALGSKRPIRLGERCTVFMEMDLLSHLQEGADKGDLAAGLAYSIALNYLNRVVRGRKIGDVIFFQGGTAYNDAVAAAFGSLLNKTIIVPPHNGVIGAMGAALLAGQKAARCGHKTRFRGYRVDQVDHALREFTCRGCSNLCEIQEFRVGEERTFWGDKCSDRYRRRPHSEKRPVIPDLFAFREALLKDLKPRTKGGVRIGIPRCLYFYDYFPFWHAYFGGIGCDVVVSEPTNQKLVDDGIEATMSEPCFPIQVSHGHVKHLADKDTEFIFVPNLVNAPARAGSAASYHCPWGQTLPFVLASARSLSDVRERILAPTIHFRDEPGCVKRELRGVARTLGISIEQNDWAVEQAFDAQADFIRRITRIGRDALRELKTSLQMAIVLVGRPYTLHDRGSNLNIPGRLREVYGVNVVPMDSLDLDTVDIQTIHPNMFWSYGRRILQAAQLVKQRPDLHILYMSNYRCGPDSFIKHFVAQTSGKPFLTLQLDGHKNDAGALTRCEAYLESKGFL